MKRESIITICLLSFLMGLGYHVWSQTLPPMPKPPRKAAATETKGATLLVQKAVVVPPQPTYYDLPAWKGLNPNWVYRLYDDKGRYLGEAGGVVSIPMTNTARYFYLRAELTRNDWLRGLPKL